MDFALEALTRDLLSEAEDLLLSHWQEIAIYRDKISLNPDYAHYITLQSKGELRVITARVDNKLVGYCVFIIGPGPHYKDTLFAENDILYITEEHRKGFNALRMLRFAEVRLKRIGVDVMLLSMKQSHPFHSLCKAMRMDPYEISYSKYIGD